MAVRYNKGLAMIRKAGKTPGETRKVSYSIEYGSDTIEMRKDALDVGQRVLICDDLLATGGTARAAVDLVESTGATVADWHHHRAGRPGRQAKDRRLQDREPGGLLR